MIGNASSATGGAMPTYRAVPTPPLSLEERQAAALKELRALRPYDADSEKKQKIVSELLGYGFDINEPIDEAGGVKIRLLDMACQEMDDDFAGFLVRQGANPRLCTNAAWFIDDMVVVFDSLQPKIANTDIEMGAIPAKSGAATSSADIQISAKNVSERKVGCCLCSMASIAANLPAVGVGCVGTVLYNAGLLTVRLLAIGVGVILCVGGVVVNGLTTLSVYLPFVIPVVAAWCVGALIDAVRGNDDMYISQSLGELISFPAHWIDIATFPLKIVSGFVSALGAGLICVGLNNSDTFKNLMRDGCAVSVNYGVRGGAYRSMHDTCYEKIIGPLSERRWSAPRVHVISRSNLESWADLGDFSRDINRDISGTGGAGPSS